MAEFCFYCIEIFGTIFVARFFQENQTTQTIFMKMLPSFYLSNALSVSQKLKSSDKLAFRTRFWQKTTKKTVRNMLLGTMPSVKRLEFRQTIFQVCSKKNYFDYIFFCNNFYFSINSKFIKNSFIFHVASVASVVK